MCNARELSFRLAITRDKNYVAFCGGNYDNIHYLPIGCGDKYAVLALHFVIPPYFMYFGYRSVRQTVYLVLICFRQVLNLFSTCFGSVLEPGIPFVMSNSKPV